MQSIKEPLSAEAEPKQFVRAEGVEPPRRSDTSEIDNCALTYCIRIQSFR